MDNCFAFVLIICSYACHLWAISRYINLGLLAREKELFLYAETSAPWKYPFSRIEIKSNCKITEIHSRWRLISIRLK